MLMWVVLFVLSYVKTDYMLLCDLGEHFSLLTTGHFGIWVLRQVSIQDSITDLVTNLVCGEALSEDFRTEIVWFEFFFKTALTFLGLLI